MRNEVVNTHTQMKGKVGHWYSLEDYNTRYSCLPLLVITLRRQIRHEKCTSCHKPNRGQVTEIQEKTWSKNSSKRYAFKMLK